MYIPCRDCAIETLIVPVVIRILVDLSGFRIECGLIYSDSDSNSDWQTKKTLLVLEIKNN